VSRLHVEVYRSGVQFDKTGRTGNVHATGASNKLLQYYTAESADIVSRLYPQDFEILGYSLCDGVTDYAIMIH
jgi:hypothetical protein